MTELLADINQVFTSVSFVLTQVAQVIANTPLLLLFAVGLPIVSFGVGLLIRVLHRT